MTAADEQSVSAGTTTPTLLAAYQTKAASGRYRRTVAVPGFVCVDAVIAQLVRAGAWYASDRGSIPRDSFLAVLVTMVTRWFRSPEIGVRILEAAYLGV